MPNSAQAVVAKSSARRELASEPLAHELFEARASAAPASVAVRFRDQQLSYGELNAKANQLARYLQKNGLGREDRVVVSVEPSFDIVVALLALLKLGAVYVPLDPSYPSARVRAMLDDTKPAFVLTQRALRERMPFAGRPLLELDVAGPEPCALSTQNLGLAVDPQQTAYVYYTSGTTGVPKGVMASHANLASYVGAAQRRYAFDRGDLGPALARYSFSISMFELLSPLLAGGTLLLLERAHVLDLARLCTTLQGVTFFHAGPSLLRGLLSYIKRHQPDFSAFSGVRHASSGGDMVPVEILEGLREVFQDAEVFVIYGCSEISCMGTTYAVPRGVPLERTYVGQPFDGTRLRVVDEQLQDSPPGVVGEVFFAGPGVVKGYLNRPELTAERFLQLDGTRFYRTGDRGRLNHQGLLELVGRSDFQVKIGGIRIELGEIEHHLRRAPGVANGVVSAKDLGEAEKTLVAYVVMEEDAEPDSTARAAAIRRHLAEHLPDYMLPALCVELAELPLNHNLKLDRNALPEPPRSVPRGGSAPQAPETPTERRLAEIWQRVLRVNRAELHDNFFDLGGSSLLALRLISEVDRELGVTLTGLQILRESLQQQAQLCDQRLERAGVARGAAAADGAHEALELFHFGPQHGLYGALHQAPAGPTDMAVLICAPLGHEQLRAHFILNRLARKLAAQGVPSLRFDYYGCGDSLGDASEASAARWQNDIVDAYQELKRRTQAKTVTGVGVRLGATLLLEVAARLDFRQLVLWDPVQRGSDYLAQLATAQRCYVRSSPLLPLKRRLAAWAAERTARRPRELLGYGYSETALDELAALGSLAPQTARCPVEVTTTDFAWLDLRQLEDMLPDLGISSALARATAGQP